MDERQINAHDFIHEQVKELYCGQVGSKVGLPGSAHNCDRNGSSTPFAPINGAAQKAVLTSIWAHILYNSQYPCLEGHPGERPMEDSMQREFYWPNMASDVGMTVRDCCQCTWKSQLINIDAPFNISGEWVFGTCHHGNSGTTPEDVNWSLLRTGNDRSFLEVNQSSTDVQIDWVAHCVSFYG